MNNEITKLDLVKDLKEIGIKNGHLLHLKVSMKAIGNVAGGAKTLVEALLQVVGENGTIVSDAFVNAFTLPLKKEDNIIVDDNTRSYAGAFANAMIEHPKMYRSKHPIQKYVAIGKYAEELCKNHDDKSGGYDLLHEMCKLDAVNLTIGKHVVGVGTTHIAIELMGFKKKKQDAGVLYKNENGEIKLAKIDWNGGCGRGFPNFFSLYREKGGMIAEKKIGNAHSYFTSMKKTLDIEIEKLKKDKTFFLCSDPTCYSCRIAWNISEKKYLKFYYNWFVKNRKELSLSRFINIFRTYR